MLNWFKKPSPDLCIKVMDDYSKYSDAEITKVVDGLTMTREWALFEEMVRRKREKLIRELTSASTREDVFRLQGHIKNCDWLLKLKSNSINIS